MNLLSDQNSSTVLPTATDDNIQGLDYENKDDNDDKKKYVYLKHTTSSKVWKVAFTAAKHAKLIKDSVIDNNSDDLYGRVESSPLLINNKIKYNTIEFMINYMNYYDNKKEKCSPTLPLKNIDISYILGDEYELFTNICNNDLDMKDKLFIYDEYIRSANYFGFEYLPKKLCAIVANILKDLTLPQLKELSSS
jgi:hypothetical protein